MYKTVSSRLTALWNPDGGHLHRYLMKAPVIRRALVEDLILHDQILVPTQDYLTACGLIILVGENGFLDLMEMGKLKFIRTRGGFGFISGKGSGEIGIHKDPKGEVPKDAPLDRSVDAGLKVIADRIKDKRKLRQIIVQNSFSIEWATILQAIKREAIRDLKYTDVWKAEYESNSPDFLILPHTDKIVVRVIGPRFDPKRNVQDTLLALTLYNSDLYLAERFECTDNSPFYAVGDLLNIKENRLSEYTGSSHKLWTLMDVNGVPDFAQMDLSEGSYVSDLLKVCTSRSATDFRDWFHSKKALSEREILREYIGIVQQVPWIHRLPVKALRFAVAQGLGLLTGLGPVFGLFDAFIIDRLFKRRSPKFFVDDLAKIGGDLKIQRRHPPDR